MSGINDAYAVRKAVDVQNDTWGHLKPDDTTFYDVVLLYTQGEYGDIVSIASSFEDLQSSPWLYEDLHAFLGDNAEEDGKIYLFEGTYCRTRTKKFMGIFRNIDAFCLRSVFHQISTGRK